MGIIFLLFKICKSEYRDLHFFKFVTNNLQIVKIFKSVLWILNTDNKYKYYSTTSWKNWIIYGYE